MAFAAVATYQDEAESRTPAAPASPPQSAWSGEAMSYTRAEVSKHKRSNDCWIIIEGRVYDVSGWLDKHPGGKRIIRHYAGEDASLAFESFHNNKKLVRSYLSKYYIGDIVEEERELPEINKDFLKLRQELIEKGFFNVKPMYFILLFLHIVVLEILAFVILWKFGNGWPAYAMSVLCLVISQAQAGWLQHDFGHRSVFNSTTLNKVAHDISIGWSKGVSSNWWNFRHYQHHAKPNVFFKDPDVTISYAFLLGKNIPRIWGERKWGIIPYHWQHKYFFFTLPPLLLPIYFHVDVVIYLVLKRKWQDFLWMITFALRWHLMFAPLLGGFWPSFKFYFLIRFLESHWFTWATQISHIPMDVDTDKRRDWCNLQLSGTCNARSNWFADWFLGHLNFQIEHHLFPTMPRHSFKSVQPYVMEFCKKHGLDYQLKPIWTAFADIVRSLKVSGEIWYNAWETSELRKKD
ncbi:PREDICTED: fatty acid desaturase 2-like [Amphimedon queenslandica]|uniref:Cytochrome b5 heme-binding domain-containing protein n=1 Tax=Amphimedon queenslandica TaxID=400682 RepID=A0A1X7V758_AMPQE|nr:PREDICTED: fatty acid desaturase 2-like [Amphimedon queenslandica]|eukprot:XP_019850246.1 PREDICTED: fatty acid desaturase 2-like [Amphimedon queenslandica]